MRERSRSRERIYQNKNQPNPKMNDQQKITATQRKSAQRVNPNYPPPPTNISSVQFKKSSSPIQFTKQQIARNYPPPSSSSKPQKLSFRQLSAKNIETLQQFAVILRNCKKPFLSTDTIVFQGILQKISNKYGFQQIYQLFIYFFIHSSTLDENVYRIFYSLGSKNMAVLLKQMNEAECLQVFYEMLIRSTLKSVFEQFKSNIKKLQKLSQSQYYLITPQLRQQIMNKSLYHTNQLSSSGCNIRTVITLIRKSMQKQKINQKTAQYIGAHPIRIILKVLKQIIKSILKKIFNDQNKNKYGSTSNTQRQKQNVFYLLIISELSLIIHYKYKFHVNAQFQQTMNEITILKMKISQLQKQNKSNNKKLNELQKQQTANRKNIQQNLQNIQINIKNCKKEHQKNYLYLIFLLNLSQYNKTCNSQCDLTLLKFYLQPILQENRKSSEFLNEKIIQKQQKLLQIQNDSKSKESSTHKQKLTFFSSIIKNYGIFSKQTFEQIQGSSQLYQLKQFAIKSYYSIVYHSLKMILADKDKIQKKLEVDYDKNVYFKRVFSALSPVYTNFQEINKFYEMNKIIARNQYGEQNSQVNEQISHHVDKQFKYLFSQLFQNLLKQIKTLLNPKATKKQSKSKYTNNSSRIKSNKQPKVSTVKKDQKLKQIQIEQPTNKTIQNDRIILLKSFQEIFISTNFYENKNYAIKSKQKVQIISFLFLLSKYKKINKVCQFQILLNFVEQEQLIATGDKQIGQEQDGQQDKLIASNKKIIDSMKEIIKFVNQLNQIQNWIMQQIKQNVTRSGSNIELRRKKQIISIIVQSLCINKCKKYVIIQSYTSSMGYQCAIHLNFVINKQQRTHLQALQSILSIQMPKNNCHMIIQQHLQSHPTKDRLDFNIQEQSILQAIPIFIESLHNFIQQTYSCTNKLITTTLNNNQIHKKLIQKRLYLLKSDLIQKQLKSILSRIYQFYVQIISNKNSIIQGHLLKVQKVVEYLLLKLFRVYHLYTNNKKEFVTIKEEEVRIDNNEKQLQFQQFLLQKLNIKQAINTKKVSQQIKNKLQGQIQSLFGQIIQNIYFQFKSSFSQIKQQLFESILTKQQDNNQSKTINLQLSLEQQIFADVKLQDILIQKLKKCISLFYDKLNEQMISNYIQEKKLFILKTLTITFYKIKTLSDILIGKLGALDKHDGNYLSKQSFAFMKDIFFYIKNEELLEIYVKFNATKDKIYLKNQIIQLREKCFNEVQQARLIQLINVL